MRRRLLALLGFAFLSVATSCVSYVRNMPINDEHHIRCDVHSTEKGKPLYFESCQGRSTTTWRVMEERVTFTCEDMPETWECTARYTLEGPTGETRPMQMNLQVTKRKEDRRAADR